MMDMFCKLDVKKTGIFAAGVLFGTAGIKVLSSKDAKKIYVSCTAAVLRAKECVMRRGQQKKWNLKMKAEPMMISGKHRLQKYEVPNLT